MNGRGEVRREKVMRARSVQQRGAGALADLHALARRRGVWTEFVDAWGKRQVATPESLVAVLRAMGEPIDGVAGAGEVLRQAEDGPKRCVPPCVVVWDGAAKRVPLGQACRAARIVLEDGGVHACDVIGKNAMIPPGLPLGRHVVEIDVERSRHRAVVLSAPTRPRGSMDRARKLGLFAPTYALWSGHGDRGVGDLGMLVLVGRWAWACGVDVLGTLPLLATFLGDPFDPSPYAPVSRMFWNEVYLDMSRVPGVDPRDAGGRPARGSGLVDWRAVARETRQVLSDAAEWAWQNDQRRTEIERWARRRPLVEEYANFRAKLDRGVDGHTARWYHIHAQYAISEQLSEMSGAAHRGELPGLYLDLPVGVHPLGFDAWRFADQFAEGCTVGAPPDALFAGGQNWGFTPPNPRSGSMDGHAYLAACVREQLKHCSMLRIDHAAALHRLYWIPEGGAAKEGVYVSQPAEELYAAINIEAERAPGAPVIVGEDLGTVPDELRRGMRRHGMLRMHVMQFAVRADERRPFEPAPEDALASFGTHDTPTLGGFVAGADIELRRSLGLTDALAARRELRQRREFVRTLEVWARERALCPAVHEALVASRARVAMVGLEDLWGEERPQNVPGVVEKYPNWQRRMSKAVEELGEDADVAKTVRGLVEWRQFQGSKFKAQRMSGRVAADASLRNGGPGCAFRFEISDPESRRARVMGGPR